MSYYGGGGGYGGPSHRREEKEEMKRLNDRLSQYIHKVRTAADTGGINNNTFVDLFKQMEDDINALRKMYEREMDDLRNQLMEANREKNANQAEADKYKKLAQELEDRLRAAEDRNHQLMGEVGELQHRVNQLERDLSEARQAAKGPREQLSNLQSQMNAVDGKNQELQRRLGDEMVARKAAEDKADQYKKKMDLNDQVNAEQMRKADELLNQAKDHIKKLEDQIQQLEKQGQTFPDLMQKMRDQLEAELEAYKRDVEDTNRRNLADMKNRLDAQGGTIQELRNANNALQAENDRLKNKISDLEAQIKKLQKQNAALEDAVNKERARGADQVRNQDKKLKDLQDKLYGMMQEANANKDDSLRLEAEIKAYGALLSDEEKRMRTSLNPAHGSGTGLNRPQLNSSYQPSNRLGNVSSGNLNDKSKYMYSGDDANRSHTSLGMAGEGTAGYGRGRPKSPLSEYMDKYRFGNPYRAPGGPMTSRDYSSGLPKIPGSRGGDLRGSGTYGNPQSGNIRYGQPAQAY